VNACVQIGRQSPQKRNNASGKWKEHTKTAHLKGKRRGEKGGFLKISQKTKREPKRRKIKEETGERRFLIKTARSEGEGNGAGRPKKGGGHGEGWKEGGKRQRCTGGLSKQGSSKGGKGMWLGGGEQLKNRLTEGRRGWERRVVGKLGGGSFG